MDILEIRKFNDPVLWKKTKEIEHFDEELEKLVLSMKKTMIKNEGVGLAAPQIGILKQILVYVNVERGEIEELINPKILKYGRDTETGEEGCLSFPGIFLMIKRKKDISVNGFNLKGEKIEIKASGMLARIFQHEIDHLNGILFFDRLTLFERIKFKTKIKFYGFDRYFN